MATMNHPYHLVEKSPWPLVSSLGAMILTTGLVKWFSFNVMNLFLLGTTIVILSSGQWWRDVSRESSFQGLHTKKVMTGLRLGVVLFIISEGCFFFSFFWAFFHSSLSPTCEIGLSWPPTHVESFNPFEIPLLNTTILLASGVTVTWAHHSILEKNFSETKAALIITITLGFYFSCLQIVEYLEAPFSIADSVYGSTFFVATGFHGLHVLIGSLFLLVMLLRHVNASMSSEHHLGLEAAIWYWHFVDVVWLFLYTFIYWWGF
uniref:Cytochrome c oxidase subunit 3 n=1 Tax=Cyamus erraticus TaxID=335539 RepID=Q4FBP3_CYAER|nr:cytochrome oxidase subunit III [Cyamus erraticus]